MSKQDITHLLDDSISKSKKKKNSAIGDTLRATKTMLKKTQDIVDQYPEEIPQTTKRNNKLYRTQINQKENEDEHEKNRLLAIERKKEEEAQQKIDLQNKQLEAVQMNLKTV